MINDYYNTMLVNTYENLSEISRNDDMAARNVGPEGPVEEGTPRAPERLNSTEMRLQEQMNTSNPFIQILERKNGIQQEEEKQSIKPQEMDDIIKRMAMELTKAIGSNTFNTGKLPTMPYTFKGNDFDDPTQFTKRLEQLFKRYRIEHDMDQLQKRALYLRCEGEEIHEITVELIRNQLIPEISSRLRCCTISDLEELTRKAAQIEKDLKTIESQRIRDLTREERNREENREEQGPPSPCRYCGGRHVHRNCPRHPGVRFNEDRMTGNDRRAPAPVERAPNEQRAQQN